jgi:spermidine/putrescine transport system ATP-binding protein
MIAGFEQPTEGEILLAGQPIAGVPPYRRNVNTVFQHYALFPHMDVAQNVGYGLRQKKVGKAEEQRRVARRSSSSAWRLRQARDVGDVGRPAAARRPGPRPGQPPTVLLLDEPLGALDLKLRKEMQLELKALQQEVGITFVYVTHDQEEALTMSDVIVVMRDGLIQQPGGPRCCTSGRSTRSCANFIGVSNPLVGKIEAFDARPAPRGSRRTEGSSVGTVTDPVPTDRRGRVTVAVRPEHLRVEPRPGVAMSRPRWTRVVGRIRQGTYLGEQTEYRVETEGAAS